MYISRIRIENFRNFRKFEVSLKNNIVLVGENKVGKTNLLQAIRLVLDPSLPESARKLRNEDFWDGLPRPLTKINKIFISIDISGFKDNENQFAVLADSLVKPEEGSDLTARLTYIYQPLPTLTVEPSRECDYEYFLYGGEKPENRLNYQIRNQLPFDILPALRDAEGDLANWKRSPLKHLLDDVANKVDRADLNDIAEDVRVATESITDLNEVTSLSERIYQRLIKMVGQGHALDTSLGISPTAPERLLRSLRLYIDGGIRSISEASLGSANIIYLVLKALHIDVLVQQKSRCHTFLAIEEPEAHLHPHLQRLVYRDLLRPIEISDVAINKDTGEPEIKKHELSSTVILTTHSPHIVSVSPIESFVILRHDESMKATVGASTANLELDYRDIEDLERYIDVTRGEILFAKSVLLVEGEAEQYIIPALAAIYGIDLDQLGITICSVSSTNFLPYMKFLGPNGTRTTYAILTDYDPRDDGIISYGIERIQSLLNDTGYKTNIDELDSVSEDDEKELIELANQYGIFLNSHTLEVDLFNSGLSSEICQTIKELWPKKPTIELANKWQADPKSVDTDKLLKKIEKIGKGRFAQRLATNIINSGNKSAPVYILNALTYVIGTQQ